MLIRRMRSLAKHVSGAENGAERALIPGERNGVVSRIYEKREEREVREWERSGERKSNKLVERGAAIQPASAPLTCSDSYYSACKNWK
jgi:hypothetical protein